MLNLYRICVVSALEIKYKRNANTINVDHIMFWFQVETHLESAFYFLLLTKYILLISYVTFTIVLLVQSKEAA